MGNVLYRHAPVSDSILMDVTGTDAVNYAFALTDENMNQNATDIPDDVQEDTASLSSLCSQRSQRILCWLRNKLFWIQEHSMA